MRLNILAHSYTVLQAIEIIKENQGKFRLRHSIKESLKDKSTTRLLK